MAHPRMGAPWPAACDAYTARGRLRAAARSCARALRRAHLRACAQATLEIVDHVRIPKGLAAGEYVLGWRWDCEQSNQIWQSCSDVTVVAP